MKYLNCIDCGKEKTGWQQRAERCRPCSKNGRLHYNRNSPPALSEETRRKMSIAKGGTGVINEKHYPGIHAWAIRNKLKTPFCEWCYSEDNLQAHHILPKVRFPQYAIDDSNCRVMCTPCHTVCHQQGGF